MSLRSSLLLLGNVAFNQDDNDRADVANQKVLDAAEALLGCGALTSELTTRTVQRGGGGKRTSTYTIDFNKLQVPCSPLNLLSSSCEPTPFPLDAFTCGIPIHLVPPPPLAVGGGGPRCAHQGHLYQALRLDRRQGQ